MDIYLPLWLLPAAFVYLFMGLGVAKMDDAACGRRLGWAFFVLLWPLILTAAVFS